MRCFYEGPPTESRLAYEALYRRLWWDSYRAACRFTRDGDTAEDLAQQAWLKIADTRSGAGRWVEGRATVRTWVLSIVDNLGKDHVRSAWVRYTTPVPEDDEGQPLEGLLGFALPPEADPALAAALRDCLNALRERDPSHYEIFIAREWQELEWVEVAERVRDHFDAGRDASSIANVCKGRHRAAKRDLKKCLEPRLSPEAGEMAAPEEARS
jgi:RNA polymerase sigma factor (sigma-70 family)